MRSIPPIIQVAATFGLIATCIRPSRGQTESLREIYSPCSIRKIAAELSRRYHVEIQVNRNLADLRVTWSYPTDVPLKTILLRLTELTDSDLFEEKGSVGKRVYTLKRKPETIRLEAAWRRSRLAHAISELLRAYGEHERGTLDVSTYTVNFRQYLSYVAPKLKYLQYLGPAQMDQLLQGEEVPIPMERVTDEDLRELIAPSQNGTIDLSEEAAKRAVSDEEIRLRRKQGLRLQIDLARKGAHSHLNLSFGSRQLVWTLARFGDEELGLPNMHVNPYRMLKVGYDDEPAPASAPLQRPLDQKLSISQEVRLEDALRQFSSASGVHIAADGYLCRRRSWLTDGALPVQLPAGTKKCVALDAVCEAYRALWWEKDGCVYLRARSWVWDVEYEPTDRFVDSWLAALSLGKPFGRIEIDSMAELNALQLNGLANMGARPRIPLLVELPEWREFFRLYAGCSKSMREKILANGAYLTLEDASRYQRLFPPSDELENGPPLRVEFTANRVQFSDTQPTEYCMQLGLARSAGKFQRMDASGVTIRQLPDAFTGKVKPIPPI